MELTEQEIEEIVTDLSKEVCGQISKAILFLAEETSHYEGLTDYLFNNVATNAVHTLHAELKSNGWSATPQ